MLDAKHGDAVRGPVRGPARRRARRRRTHRRSARRVPGRARQARRQVALPQLRAGEARRARRRRHAPARPRRRRRRRAAAPRRAAPRRAAGSGRTDDAAGAQATPPKWRRDVADDRASHSRGSRSSGLSRCGARRMRTSSDPVDLRRPPVAVVRLAAGEQQEARPAARAQADVPRRRSTGRSPSARRRPGFAPVVTADAIYAAATDGTLVRIDPATGRTVWRISAGKRVVGGRRRGRDARRRRHRQGRRARVRRRRQAAVDRARCRAKSIAPPRVGRRRRRRARRATAASSRLDAADGKTKWVNQRTNPPLTVRNFAGGVIDARRPVRRHRRRPPAGARPRARASSAGTRPSPRRRARPSSSASPTSRRLPLIDGQQVCAVAYQGRVACFDIVRGTLNWSRDVSSLDGLAGDGTNVYVTDDKGAVHALDKTTGASVWKQDQLAAAQDRRPAGGRRLRRRRRRRGLRAPARRQQRRVRRTPRHRRHGADRRSPRLLAGAASLSGRASGQRQRCYAASRRS